MKTNLERLLESIDPVYNLDQVSARADQALNSFRLKSGVIEEWEGFRTVLAEFLRHVENLILRIRPSFPGNPAIDWGRCCNLLIREYGGNGEKAAFEIARTGAEGGIHGILKALARQMIEEYAGNEIAARIAHFWETLSTDERLAVSHEYLEKYAYLLPSELTSGSAARVRANFPKVLEEHPKVVKRLRSIGRGY